MTDKRLLNARDLQVANEYAKVDGGKRLVAITRSSKSLGLIEREEVNPPKPASFERTDEGSAPRRGRGKGE